MEQASMEANAAIKITQDLAKREKLVAQKEEDLHQARLDEVSSMLEYEALLVAETRELQEMHLEKMADTVREETLQLEAKERAVKDQVGDESLMRDAADAKAEEKCLELEERYLANQSFDALTAAVSPSAYEHRVTGPRISPSGQIQHAAQVKTMMA